MRGKEDWMAPGSPLWLAFARRAGKWTAKHDKTVLGSFFASGMKETH